VPLEEILALVLLAALVLYALGGGADYGGGIWDLLARGPRVREQREAIEHAIAPIWEANHVWLIVVVVVLFTAFPPAFGALMVALHIPLTVVLLGVVARGSAFAFRKYDLPDDHVHRRWSAIFGIASLLTPFFLGISLGAIASGSIRVRGGEVTTGFFAGWTEPFALSCGVFAQALFAFLAAVYLTVDTEDRPALQNDFRRRALATGVGLIPIGALVFALAASGAPEIFAGLTSGWAPPLFAATTTAAGTAIGALIWRWFYVARAAAIAVITLVLLGWGLAQYPYAIVPDMTFTAARTSARTLELLTWALAAGALILFPSFAYLFLVFRSPGAASDSEPPDVTEP
jgi:cytochrome d ubiquinol oxidase subunit II